MTRAQVLLLIVIAFAVAFVVTWKMPVRAAEPVCQSEEQVTELVTRDGGTIAGAAYYRGSTTDTMLVVETPDAIVIYGFKAGCLVAAVSLEPRAQGVPA